MDNTFFRSQLPYNLKIEGDCIIVKNRSYKPIGKYRIPKRINKKQLIDLLLNGVSIDSPTCVDCDRIWLYDDAHCPIANEKGFDKQLYHEYSQRLELLTKILSGFESEEILNDYTSDFGNLFQEAISIIQIAKDNYELFSNKFSDSLRISGERNKDGAIYVIKLSDSNYNLIISAENYSVKTIEIRSHKLSLELDDFTKIFIED